MISLIEGEKKNQSFNDLLVTCYVVKDEMSWLMKLPVTFK